MARRLLRPDGVSAAAASRIRVAICGLASTAIDTFSLVVLIELGRLPVGPAAFLAAAIGAIANFLGNKRWGFGDGSPIDVRQLAAYAAVCLGSWSAVAVGVHVITFLGAPYLASKAVAALLVFLAWSYPAQARFVFPQADRSFAVQR
jgi:putative flippase GtrA